jgi:hypothetical protein
MAATTLSERHVDADTNAIVSFFLTGRRTDRQLDAVDGLALRPALFAGYRDLTELRYDFPVVLVDGCADQDCILSLSGIVDAALAKTAQGADADRIRKHALRIERQIRVLVAAGTAGTLRALWEQAARQLGESNDGALDTARRVAGAFAVDGEVVDCDARMPARIVAHAWAAGQQRKAHELRLRVERLVLRLSDILKADDERSLEARSAAHLASSIGPGFGGAFDFDAMSAMLSSLPRDALSDARRRRIESLLQVLRGQAFFPAERLAGMASSAAQPYLFPSCGEALAAWRERMPARTELAKALAIAELEVDGVYSEARHDALFEEFGANGLERDELGQFPDYLVALDATTMTAAEHDRLMDLFFSRLPIKVLLQIDDILEPSQAREPGATVGVRTRQFANMAIGLNEVYVLQSSSSNLFRYRARLMNALDYRGPAFISVFSGASGTASGLPAYLVSAAAMESRAFPAFVYDPSSGADWASRFSLDANPQVALDWPIQGFRYEDEEHQRVSEDIAFTYVDFAAADRRYAAHMARIPRSRWNGGTAPVDESLARERKGFPDKVPSVMMVDREDRLQRVVVDEWLVREARRCREMWHSLQELGGIHNSHAEKLLARERQAWEARMKEQAEALAAASPSVGAAAPLSSPVASPAAQPAAAAAVAAPESEPERSPDIAWIDTPRCSSCEECIHINNRMFAYDGNKQAFIADVAAGTYAQLVEAAESCQVAIIHPGKPANASEPGLEELLKRAEPFLL